MAALHRSLLRRIDRFVDSFIPAGFATSSDGMQGVRMFLFSHLFGPFLGHTISISMLILQGYADISWWIFFTAVTLFWLFPFVFRFTGSYVPLAVISVQNLIFCILWGAYHYGGISSPIMPWLITVPLFAFFYLPTPRTRIVVALMIGMNLLGFYAIYSFQGFPEVVPLNSLVGLGLVSTICASVYVSMMALYYASIVSSQFDLEQEVSRHLNTARALKSATEQVERATRAKSEFLARMSHELRNPLNAIIGYSELIMEHSSSISAQKLKDLSAIRGAGLRLLTLVNDLLDLSKLEAGKMEYASEEIPVHEFVEEVAQKVRPALVEKGIELHVECPGDLGSVVCDRGKLVQAVDNLLSNGAKFTKHGSVTLAVSKEDGSIVISVRDTGIGMSPSQINSLFDTFGSRDNETASNYGDDPGLGLPLTYRICRSMGGDLTVVSELGRGSSFMIRLPLQAANNGDPGSSEADDEVAAAA